MIGVKFNGRLGNQLFQYVFFQYLRSNNKRRLFYFANPHHSYFSKYFDLDYSYLLDNKFCVFLSKVLTRLIPFREIYIQSIEVPKPVKARNWTLYKGFFQNDWYLNNTPEKYEIKLKKQFVDEFVKDFGDLFSKNKIIVVHIRRTDYLKYGKRDISLPMEYFKDRLDHIKDVDSYKVIFVSDDMEHVKLFFPAKDNYIFSSNSEIIDFQIIQNADVAIISNSSFAWWASYLSPKSNLVYAPKNWLAFRIGKEHPKKIMTDKFIWCDVLNENKI
ncbi:MAG: alpha-1,2-fucosyltransferase [Bacteroidota bacterium]